MSTARNRARDSPRPRGADPSLTDEDADAIELEEAEMSDAVGAAAQAEEEAPLLVTSASSSSASRPLARPRRKPASKHWWTICGTKVSPVR